MKGRPKSFSRFLGAMVASALTILSGPLAGDGAWRGKKRGQAGYKRQNSSKYMPHQGARECYRRRIGGFHTLHWKNTGESNG